MSFMDIDMYNGYNNYLVSRNNRNNRNIDIAINNIINQFSNHYVVNVPIDQIVSSVPICVPIVDGYFFNGWDEDYTVVSGQLTNEADFPHEEELLPIGRTVQVGNPIFRALDLCVISGQKI